MVWVSITQTQMKYWYGRWWVWIPRNKGRVIVLRWELWGVVRSWMIEACLYCTKSKIPRETVQGVRLWGGYWMSRRPEILAVSLIIRIEWLSTPFRHTRISEWEAHDNIIANLEILETLRNKRPSMFHCSNLCWWGQSKLSMKCMLVIQLLCEMSR